MLVTTKIHDHALRYTQTSLNHITAAKRMYIDTVVQDLKERFEGILTYFLQPNKFLVNEI